MIDKKYQKEPAENGRVLDKGSSSTSSRLKKNRKEREKTKKVIRTNVTKHKSPESAKKGGEKR